jgi:hypothetical protein
MAAAIPLWDVALTSADMNSLCVSAGVSVKKRVFVDGFLTPYPGADYRLKHGFKYIETREGSEHIVYYTREDGNLKALEHLSTRYKPRSRYELVNEAYGEVVPTAHNVDTDRTVVRDRVTGEELGRAVRYRAYPGWVDRHTLAKFGQIQWRCPEGKDTQEIDLEHAVLLPSQP